MPGEDQRSKDPRHKKEEIKVSIANVPTEKSDVRVHVFSFMSLDFNSDEGPCVRTVSEEL